MKNINKTTSIVTSIFAASFIWAGSALAAPGHDHSNLPVGWTFDPIVINKISKNLDQGNRAIGLSPLEQGTLSDYGIKIGNTFKANIDGEMMKVIRTSSGIRVEGTTLAHADGFQVNLPVRQSSRVIRSSFTQNHAGHDHQHLAIEWVFNRAIEKKIANNLENDNASGAIGLSHKEQRILGRYGIKVGNQFNAHVNEMDFTMKRTTMGLQVMKHLHSMPIASLPADNSDKL